MSSSRITVSRDSSHSSMKAGSVNNDLAVASSTMPANRADGALILQTIKSVASSLRKTAADNKKLANIKGNEELVHRINEVLQEIDQQSPKIVSALAVNPAVVNDLTMLQEVPVPVHQVPLRAQRSSLALEEGQKLSREPKLHLT